MTAFVAIALRTKLLEPRVGADRSRGRYADRAGIFGVIIWTAAPWITPRLEQSQLLMVGIGWVLATVLFEFGFGHYVMVQKWSKLLAHYNLFVGRILVLVLLTMLFMPLLAGEFQWQAH